VVITLKTFSATFLFGGLRGLRMLGATGKIQYEFYGVRAFWAGQEETVFQYLAWGADLLVGLGFLLTWRMLVGRADWKGGVGGGISALAAALIPWAVLHGLTLFLSTPPEITVTVQVQVTPGFFVTLAAGLLMLVGSWFARPSV